MSGRAAATGRGVGSGCVRDGVRVDLVSDGRAAGQARRGVRQVLALWQLPALIDSVVLAVSELVTNAVRYGRPPLFLVLRRDGTRVRLDVHDASPTGPADKRTPAGPAAESGRGLNIVAAVAVEVGCEQVPGDGKIMYAAFDTREAPRTH